MTYEELLEKYQALLVENSSLKEEIVNLNAKLDVLEHRAITDGNSDINSLERPHPKIHSSLELFSYESEGQTLQSNMNSQSDPVEKIKLFMSLFKGRDDVYAKRWENKKKGTAGYSPFCSNE